jgi:glucoamylase
MAPAPGTAGADPSLVAPYMFALMQRNISTAGFVLADHNASAAAPVPGGFSAPGCILASPSWAIGNNSYPGNVAEIAEDYAFNWTRDAAIAVSTVLKQAPALLPAQAANQIVANYANFAAACQNSGGSLGQAKYTPEGGATGAPDESDGPALRILTLLQGFAGLSDAMKGTAAQVISNDLAYLLGNGRYQNATVTLWEDTIGQSIFARAVQLRCLNQLTAAGPGFGIPVPSTVAAAVSYLSTQVQDNHWDDTNNRYISVLGASRLWGDPPVAYDPAIDPILACLYGDGIDCTDPRLLSTAAQVRAQWTVGGPAYPINASDAQIGVGPLVGRYNGDEYNGFSLNSATGHPWAVCTCGFAQLYYMLAGRITAGTPVPSAPLASAFLSQVNVTSSDPPATVAAALRTAGDGMLNAVVYHSNCFELSEQFDQATGYELSVSNLTWSYAAFLNAIGVR